MHVNFMIPAWMLVLAGGLTYPTIGVAVANFLLRHSRRKMHGALVFGLAALWPATFAGVIAAAPIWAVVWILTNYSGAIKRLVGGQVFSGMSSHTPRFNLGTCVRVLRDTPVEGRLEPVPGGWNGRIVDQNGSSYKVDFGTGCGTYWVHESALTA